MKNLPVSTTIWQGNQSEKKDPQSFLVSKNLLLIASRVLIRSAAQNSGFLAVLGMYVPFLCSWFPNAVGYTLFLESGNAAREFFRPFFQQHSATLTPGQPRDVMDIYLEKVNESKDDPGSSFHDCKTVENFQFFSYFNSKRNSGVRVTPSS